MLEGNKWEAKAIESRLLPLLGTQMLYVFITCVCIEKAQSSFDNKDWRTDTLEGLLNARENPL
jgi:hypothetical protein